MKRLLVLTMVLVAGLAPLRAQSVEIAKPPQDCAIVAAEYIHRLQVAGISAIAVGLKLQNKMTGRVGGHVVTLWQPCKGGDYYISDYMGSVRVPCLPTDSMDTILKAIQKLVDEQSNSTALSASILW